MSSPSPVAHVTPASRFRLGLRCWAWIVTFPLAAVAVDQLMRHLEMPAWLQVLLALSPLVPGAMFLRALNRTWVHADELALHISREALGFVFFALIGVFVCVDLLENSGLLKGFVWDTKRLVAAMGLLALVGYVISSRRYR